MSQLQPRKTEILPIDVIEMRGRIRPVNKEGVARIAASMEKIGLRTPISIRYYQDRPADLPSSNLDEAFVLMTGGHRLEAARSLGWSEIECFVYDAGDEVDAKLWEIAENLHRSDLTTLERDEQIALWVKLNQARVDASQRETHEKPGQQPGGVNAAARELGLSKHDAHRAVKVGGLTEEAKQAARDTGLDDNRSALLKAAREAEPARQAEVLREHAQSLEQGRGGIAARLAPATETQADHISTWRRFLDAASILEGLPVAGVVAGALQSGSNGRAQVSSRARSVADRMDGIISEADR